MIDRVRRGLLTALIAAPMGAALPIPDAGAQDDLSGTLGVIVDRVLTEYERQVIREYYGRRGGDGPGRGRGGDGLPPGLAKKNRLPPGLERQLVEGGRLPPGLERRALPSDLRARLPRRRGTDRVVVDRDVVLIETATGLILDILRGAAG